METRIEYDGAQAIINKVEELLEPTPIDIEADRVVALPKGLELVSLKKFRDELADRPERRVGTAKLTTLESFCEHVARFADEHSAIFASEDPSTPKLEAVLDYHEKGAAGAPRFGKHRAVYFFPLSDEWKAWTKKTIEHMSQADFSAFLEDHLADVRDPSNIGAGAKTFATTLGVKLATPSDLLGLSKGLSLRVEANVAHHVTLSSGEGQIHYEEKHTERNGDPVRVPGGFVVAIPVFRRGAAYELPARLRYRVVSGGKITWKIDLHGIERVFAHAFEEATNTAKLQTGLPLFYGTPE